MNIERLYSILDTTTMQLPNESEADESIEKVDLQFIVVGVNKEAAEMCRDAVIEILAEYPEPERLAGGPSYIEVGAAIGDQGRAFQLFALGKVLGFWTIITPATLGITGDAAATLAGQGMVMISGYKGEAIPAA